MHPRHRNPPPVDDDKGREPFDAAVARGDEELDRELDREAERAEAASDDRFARSVDHR